MKTAARALARLGLYIICVTLTTRAQAAVDTTGLIGYWKFDDTVGSTTAADSSGKGYSGTVVNNSTGANIFGTPGRVGTAWTTVSDGAAWPNMLTDYIQLPASTGNELRLANTSFTLTGWFKWNSVGPAGASGNPHMFDGNNNSSSTGWYQHLRSGQGSLSEQFTFSAANKNAAITSLPGGPWATGVWYFFASRYDDTTHEIVTWLVRENQAWTARSGAVATGVTTPGDPGVDPRIGRVSAPGAFDGVLDEFSMWSRALATSEVEQIFNAGKLGESFVVIPEPSTLLLLGLGLVVVCGSRQRGKAVRTE